MPNQCHASPKARLRKYIRAIAGNASGMVAVYRCIGHHREWAVAYFGAVSLYVCAADRGKQILVFFPPEGPTICQPLVEVLGDISTSIGE